MTHPKIGDFIEVTRMTRFQMILPLIMERIPVDGDGRNFQVVAGGYSFSGKVTLKRGFKLILKGAPTADIGWHVIDPDNAWAMIVAEQLLGEPDGE